MKTKIMSRGTTSTMNETCKCAEMIAAADLCITPASPTTEVDWIRLDSAIREMMERSTYLTYKGTQQ